jgi:hypothetical protein
LLRADVKPKQQEDDKFHFSVHHSSNGTKHLFAEVRWSSAVFRASPPRLTPPTPLPPRSLQDSHTMHRWIQMCTDVVNEATDMGGMEGFLKKRGGIRLHTWQQRWFMLMGNELCWCVASRRSRKGREPPLTPRAGTRRPPTRSPGAASCSTRRSSRRSARRTWAARSTCERHNRARIWGPRAKSFTGGGSLPDNPPAPHEASRVRRVLRAGGPNHLSASVLDGQRFLAIATAGGAPHEASRVRRALRAGPRSLVRFVLDGQRLLALATAGGAPHEASRHQCEQGGCGGSPPDNPLSCPLPC